MADPTDYTQLPNGLWFRISDNSGPYAKAADGPFVLVSTLPAALLATNT